ASTPEARHKYMVGMDNDIQDLDKLVDEMLTYARLEQGSPTLNFQRIDLDALINQVIAELSPLRANVTQCDASCRIRGAGGLSIESGTLPHRCRRRRPRRTGKRVGPHLHPVHASGRQPYTGVGRARPRVVDRATHHLLARRARADRAQPGIGRG
nr:hypothetical protein [Tanacetum cinerariifolium]